ncbi:c-type cytochrome [Planctomicrobium sp. SH661]|uniref:c-type cytochrome n=1 Tax=Planctomicrobium sp. SH661 TaxID=3448124 RepID=UPI003F5BCE23
MMLKSCFGVWLMMTVCVPVLAAEKVVEKGNEKVSRGKYLVHHVAMCIYCHTPKDQSGNLDQHELLAGATMPVGSPYPNQTWGFRAPNLRSLPARWGEEEFAEFLQTGKTPNGYTPRLPMPPFRMTPDDAAAVAAYLNSLESEE